MYKYVITALLAALLAGCNREEPVDIHEQYVFFADLAIDGNSAQWIAGQGFTYLFTRLEQGVSGIPVCSGLFAQTSCPEITCPNTLKISINGLGTGPVSPDSLFHTTPDFNYPFAGLDSLNGPEAWQLFGLAGPGNLYSNFTWDIAGVGAYTTETFLAQVNDTTGKTIVLSGYRNNTIRGTVTRTVSVTDPFTLFYPSVYITAFRDTSGSQSGYTFQAHASGAIFSLAWSNGVTDTTFFVPEDSLGNAYTVSVTDVYDHLASSSLIGFSDALPFYQSPLIEYSSQLILLPSPQTGAVVIQWTDATGATWRSDLAPQPGDALFHVLETAPYEPNEQGRPTWKLKAVVNCRLYNSFGEYQTAKGTVTFAVAY